MRQEGVREDQGSRRSVRVAVRAALAAGTSHEEDCSGLLGAGNADQWRGQIGRRERSVQGRAFAGRSALPLSCEAGTDARCQSFYVH
jgi:hypothetical protein